MICHTPTVAAMHPYYILRALGGGLYLLGALVMAYNVFMTIRGHIRAEIPMGGQTSPVLQPAE